MDTDQIFGWFPVESQVALKKIIEENEIKSVIEVGCFLGKATAFFAGLVDKVYVVDTFKMNAELKGNGDSAETPDHFFATFKDNMVRAGIWDKIHVLEMPSHEAAEVCPAADLIYIDAGHDFGNVRRDLLAWHRKAFKVIAGDDYDENWPGVKQAIDSLKDSTLLGCQEQIVGRLWFIKKNFRTK